MKQWGYLRNSFGGGADGAMPYAATPPQAARSTATTRPHSQNTQLIRGAIRAKTDALKVIESSMRMQSSDGGQRRATCVW